MGEAKGYDGSRRWRDASSSGAWITGLVVACWLLAFHAAALLEYHGTASLWYPPAAVSFAAFVVFRWRAWPAVVLANLWACRQTLVADGAGFDALHTLLAGLGYALAHGVPYWILGECVLRSIPRSHAASALPRTVATFLIAGLLAAVTAAGASAWVTSALGLLSRDGIWPLTLPPITPASWRWGRCWCWPSARSPTGSRSAARIACTPSTTCRVRCAIRSDC